MNDGKLIKELKKGNEQAFNEIYYAYYKLVYYQAYEVLNNKEDAEDVMQTTFINFVNHIDDIRNDSNIKQVLMKIAKNAAIDQYRKNRAKIYDASDKVIDDKVEDNKDIDTIITLNNVLEKDEAKIATLKIVYEYSFQEIANEMNLSLNTVQARYYKAIEKLKEYYKEEN